MFRRNKATQSRRAGALEAFSFFLVSARSGCFGSLRRPALLRAALTESLHPEAAGAALLGSDGGRRYSGSRVRISEGQIQRSKQP